MSKEQENFDDLLRSKLDGAEFDFNESNWEKAEELIIQAEKKRKRRLFGFIFFIGLILGVCVMIPFTYEKENQIPKPLSNASTNTRKTLAERNAMNNSGENTLTERAQPGISNPAKTSESKPEINSNLHQNSDKKDNSQLPQVSDKLATKDIQPENNNKAKQKSVVTGQNLQNKKAVHLQATFKVPVNQGKITEANSTSLQANKKSKKDTNAFKDRNETVEINKITSAAEKSKALKHEGINEIKNSDTIPALADLNANNLVDSVSILKDTLNHGKDSLVKITKTDNSIGTPEKDEKFKPATFLSLDAGIMYSLGWAYGSSKEAGGFNGMGGISVTHIFTRKISILAGLQYSRLAHLSYSSYVSTNIQYGFGYSETKTTITPAILHYLAVPIKIQFHLNDKNSLSLGINTLCLLNTSGKMENETHNDFSAPSTTYTTKWGYRDGFSGWDIQPALAYRRKLYKAFSLSAEVYYGLIDIKNNTAFGVVKTERNSGLKLTLTYNLSHK